MQEKAPDIRIADIPDKFLHEIQRALSPYSVAIARVKGDDASTFQPLGTGVFVKRDGWFGVLTAYHCLHNCTPHVTLGHDAGDTLLFIMNNGRQMVLKPFEVAEEPLAIPLLDVSGPDLTFIRIMSEDRISSIKAIGSFWNLSQEMNPILEKYSEPKTPLASIGFPGMDYVTEIDGFDIHHKVCNMTYLNAIGEGDITTLADWDYIDLTCTYTKTNNLPVTFAGVSGGPVWAYELNISKSTGEYSLGKFALVGIKFYQSALIDNQRKLKAHFIRSIYDTAWKNAPLLLGA